MYLESCILIQIILLELNNMQLETVFILSFFSTSKIVTRKSWVARQFFFLDGENPDSLGVTEDREQRPKLNSNGRIR